MSYSEDTQVAKTQDFHNVCACVCVFTTSSTTLNKNLFNIFTFTAIKREEIEFTYSKTRVNWFRSNF